MKTILLMCFLAVALLAGHAKACDGVYLKVGYGLKHSMHNELYVNGERRKLDNWSKHGARFELGANKGNLSAGLAHYSQWDTGWPFNDEKEPARSELFIDYKIDLWSWK